MFLDKINDCDGFENKILNAEGLNFATEEGDEDGEGSMTMQGQIKLSSAIEKGDAVRTYYVKIVFHIFKIKIIYNLFNSNWPLFQNSNSIGKRTFKNTNIPKYSVVKSCPKNPGDILIVMPICFHNYLTQFTITYSNNKT